MTTTTTTNALPEAHEEWKRAHALLESMYAWANDEEEQIKMCVEVEGILDDVDDALMATGRVQRIAKLAELHELLAA